jgi:hypothetical protein
MIIQDLEHLEFSTQLYDVRGGISASAWAYASASAKGQFTHAGTFTATATFTASFQASSSKK